MMKRLCGPVSTGTLLVFFFVTAWLDLQFANAQSPPYDRFPDAKPPYYRVRYEASEDAGELIFAVNYTIWIPPNAKKIRGIVVHQHGCGEGSCSSGLSGAYDLHWQALAERHDCALLAPAYEQPQSADCQMWCDPRNGSAKTFLRALANLGQQSGHAELQDVPWALWGHSGGGHWCGGMVMLYPDRVAAAWLRSGVPLFKPNPERPKIKTHTLPDGALKVPIMCNPGTKEGVTVTTGRFAKVWPANQAFFSTVRGRGGLICVAVDPLTAHECGNQRYLAIPWLSECLKLRLPHENGASLTPMPIENAWLSELTGTTVVAESEFKGDAKQQGWLVNQSLAKQWQQYVTDTRVTDTTSPPAPDSVVIADGTLRWTANADLQSGISHFIIRLNGKVHARVPETSKNRFGRPLFQNLLYSDTPTQPLAKMELRLSDSGAVADGRYEVITVNTVGLHSNPTVAVTSE